MSRAKQVAGYHFGVATFGLYLPQVNIEFREVGHAAQAAEALGYGHIWFIDHFEVPGTTGVLDGWTVASAVAAMTEHIRIGHLVLNAAVRHPSLLAKMAASLDQVSGGRFDLGLGWGSDSQELHTYLDLDEPFSARRARMSEAIDIVREMHRGRPTSVRGRYWSVDGATCAPLPVQQPVPVVIGGAGTATMRLVREHADWWNCPSYGRHRLDELVKECGRARISANYSIALEEREPELRRAGHPNAPVLVGSPDAIASELVADQSRGVELFNIQFVRYDCLIGQMECFMSRVVPILMP